MAVFDPIPNETPIDDWSELKIPGISTRGQLNDYEARNILKATKKYLARKPTKRQAPFTYSWTLRLHKEMFGDVWAYAGNTRTQPINIGVDPIHIQPQLYELLQSLPHWNHLPIIQQAAMLHHRAVAIHPFKNGNGRWSRLLTNIWLRRSGNEPTVWPETLVGTTSPIRNEYIEAIKKADQGEYEALIELHRRYTPSN